MRRSIWLRWSSPRRCRSRSSSTSLPGIAGTGSGPGPRRWISSSCAWRTRRSRRRRRASPPRPTSRTARAEPKDKPKRKPLPADLPRNEQVLSPGDACGKCGGKLKTLGEDVTEELEYVPGRFVVNRIVRPRMACSCCEAICQAPLPSRPIERGRPGPGLLAHVLVSKYGDHLPLYRQSPDLRAQRHRSRPLDPGRLGRQIGRPAGAAGRRHRAPCARRDRRSSPMTRP